MRQLIYSELKANVQSGIVQDVGLDKKWLYSSENILILRKKLLKWAISCLFVISFTNVFIKPFIQTQLKKSTDGLIKTFAKLILKKDIKSIYF